jgi:guanine deaminase
MQNKQEEFIMKAISIAQKGLDNNSGGPFGAVVVRNNEVIAKGSNQVTSTNDPSAHAEIVAIRRACKKLGTFQLTGCQIYSSCEPCPMCLGAIYWARPDALYFASTREDAAQAGFDDSFIYSQIDIPYSDRKIPTVQIKTKEADFLFQEWIRKENKILY